MIPFLVTIHVLSALLLVLSILLQPGRSSGFSVTFSETATAIFGGKGATSFLEKFTAGAATVFILTSILLALRLGRGGGGSVMKNVQPPPPATQPQAAPATAIPGAPGTAGPPGAAPSAPPVIPQPPASQTAPPTQEPPPAGAPSAPAAPPSAAPPAAK